MTFTRGAAMASKPNQTCQLPRPPTGEQLRVQSETTILSAAWNALTEEQRVAWCGRARENRRSGAKAGKRSCTGRMLFFRVNSHRLALRQPLLADPPDEGDYVSLPEVKLVITNRAGRITLKLKVSGGDPHGVMVSSWHPVSPGTMICRNFVRIGPMPPPVRGMSDFTRQYVEKYGVPPVGTKVFVRVQQMKDLIGRLVQTTSAIVRPEEGWDDEQRSP
jgi:hypothetical protein